MNKMFAGHIHITKILPLYGMFLKTVKPCNDLLLFRISRNLKYARVEWEALYMNHIHIYTRAHVPSLHSSLFLSLFFPFLLLSLALSLSCFLGLLLSYSLTLPLSPFHSFTLFPSPSFFFHSLLHTMRVYICVCETFIFFLNCVYISYRYVNLKKYKNARTW